MHSIRIIGPGRAGTSLAVALSARGWTFAGFRGRHDDVADAARGVDVLVIATPDDAIAEVAAAVVPEPGDDGRAPLGLARARCAGAPPAPRRRPPARPAAQRRGRGGPPRLGRDLRRGRRSRRTRAGRVPRRPAGRGGRRGPGRLPRHRLHRRQPRRGSARPGRARGRLGRAGPRVLLAADPGRRRRRGRARRAAPR